MTSVVASAMPVALITGAHGGMGTACARVFGQTRRLVLTDLDAGRLAALRNQLEADGAEVVETIAADLTRPGAVERVVEAVKAAGRLGTVVHTAGVSPSLAEGWEPILELNLTASVRLLDALEPQLAAGTACILIASMAGYSMPPTPELTAAVQALIQQGDPALLAAMIAGEADPPAAAYVLSKFGVLRLVESRAPSWARAGARIVSLSPGFMRTPMGLIEDRKPNTQALRAMTPIARWGTALDVAHAAEFLASDRASFISGCDLRIDGALVPALSLAGSGENLLSPFENEAKET